MREEIKLLKDHAHLASVDVDVTAVRGDILTLKEYPASRRLFQTVEAAQKC